MLHLRLRCDCADAESRRGCREESEDDDEESDEEEEARLRAPAQPLRSRLQHSADAPARRAPGAQGEEGGDEGEEGDDEEGEEEEEDEEDDDEAGGELGTAFLLGGDADAAEADDDDFEGGEAAPDSEARCDPPLCACAVRSLVQPC